MDLRDAETRVLAHLQVQLHEIMATLSNVFEEGMSLLDSGEAHALVKQAVQATHWMAMLVTKHGIRAIRMFEILEV